MTLLSNLWFAALLLSEPTGEAPIIPWWLWAFLGIIIIGLPILTVVFGPGLRRQAVVRASAPPKEPAEAPEAATAAAPPAGDDLTRIEGIGPKIAATLRDAGITTYEQLGTTSVDRVQAILDQDPNLRLADPTSWNKQAILAAAGDWEELDRLQAELKGGRQTG